VDALKVEDNLNKWELVQKEEGDGPEGRGAPNPRYGGERRTVQDRKMAGEEMVISRQKKAKSHVVNLKDTT